MKKIFNYLFVALLMGITIYIIFKSNSLSDIESLYQRSNKYYIIMGILFLFMFLYIDSVIVYVLSNRLHKSITSLASLQSALIGQYYCLITPFAAGAQPAQIFYFSQKGVPVGKSTAVFLNKYIIYEAAVTVLTLFLFIPKLMFYRTTLNTIYPFIILGLLIHGIGTAIIFSIIYFPSFIEKIVFYVMNFLHKIRIIKNLDKHFHKFKLFMNEYNTSLKLMVDNKSGIIKAFILTFAELIFFMSITYCVYKALNLTGYSYFDILSLQAMLHIAVSFFPTPGTLGPSEAGFYIVFSPVFNQHSIAYALLLWRGITFYFNLIICGIATGISHLLMTKK